eukprot:1158123-Pelagomonas_calceolata.AAC.3
MQSPLLIEAAAKKEKSKSPGEKKCVQAKVGCFCVPCLYTPLWLGALAVGALSIWATVPAAERAQTWARALLQSKLLDVAESYANEEEDSSSDEDDDGSATGGHDASHSNSSSTSVPGHGSTSSSSSTSDYGKVGSADGISSSSSSSNGKEENSSSNMAEDGADSIQALVYNAATGQVRCAWIGGCVIQHRQQCPEMQGCLHGREPVCYCECAPVSAQL